MIRLIHYRDKCIGCGICYEMQPEHWRMSMKDGKAHLLRASEKKGIHQIVTRSSKAHSQQVAQACPVNAIKVESAGRMD